MVTGVVGKEVYSGDADFGPPRGGTKANNGTGGAGTANRGGGGGGAGGSYHPSYNNNGGTGGKGIVIIRYKYQ